MTPDSAVRDTISRSGLDRTLFVEAGAGTGKTTALVERIANLVLVHGVRLASIAAITFTEAAATELRDRVRRRFERDVVAAADAITRERAADALAETDLAAISTLHAFAQRILSEHPAHSGLPPRIGVLDEVASTLEREARWERFVDSLHDDPANEDLLVRAALLGITIEPTRMGQASLKDIAARLGESWDRLGPVAELDHPDLPPVDLTPLDLAVTTLEELATTCTDHSDKLHCHLVEVLLPHLHGLLAIPDPSDRLRHLVRDAPAWRSPRGGRATAWGGDVDTPKEAVKAVCDARDQIIAGACHEVLSRLTTLVARDLLAAAETRRVEGRLEFHDLLVLAKRLLHQRPSARVALHERYTHLLLDEFQDTDPLQIELAVLIAASVEATTPDHWAAAEVPDGRLFFVGDPKQSIYRFRRADIELFLAARERFGDGAALQRLATNFRTVEPVIAWVNAVFEQLMADGEPGMQPAYEPLHAHRAPPPDVDARPILLGGAHQGLSAAEVREIEAADLAATIDDVVRSPDRWLVADPAAPDGRRPAQLRDVTILIPTRTELPALQSALRERQIPAHVATGTLIYETQEVRDALAVLTAVADPSDELALVAALRSPLYACTDHELFEFHTAGGRWSIQRPPPRTLGPDHPVAVALAHLRTLWEQRWWVAPSVLLTQLLAERHAAVVAFGGERPEESWSRLRFLVDQARAFEEAGGGDLRRFLDWAELQRSETVTVHEPVPADAGTDAVSIMTIHGAKGLEFPVTVLAGMSARPQPAVRGASVIWDAAGYPGVALRRGVATTNHDGLRGVEQQMADHERMRLLYVAATRARDHLVVSCHHQVNNRSLGAMVWDAASTRPDTWRSGPPEAPGPAEPVASTSTPADGNGGRDAPASTSTDAARERWRRERAETLAVAGRRRVVSATAIARDAAAARIDPDAEALVDDDAPVPVRRRGRAGTAIGRAVHATLQLVDLHDPSGVEAEARRQAHLEAIPELAPTVAAMARGALEAPTVRNARRYHREVYVAAPIGETVLEGYVDLLVETPEGLVVVDYKTDAVDSETDIDEKLADYELQGAAYALALEASTGMPVVACRFVFCDRHGARERQVGDLPGAMARARTALTP